MTFLPIVSRELRVRARRPATYRVRVGGTVIATAVAVFVLLINQMGGSPSRIGAGMFTGLSWLIFIFCLLEGARQTADCLSSEKRAGTIGLLFLTDLKGYDVVLGKWFAASLNSVYVVLAVLPILAIPLLLGGVSGGEFWRTVLVVLHTLLLSLNTGMLISAIYRDERRVLWHTVAALLLLSLVPLLVLRVPGSGFAAIQWASPAAAFLKADHLRYSAGPRDFWMTIAALQALSWAFLALAAFFLPRCWQERAVGDTRRATRLSQARTLARNRPYLDLNPVLWLAAPNRRQAAFIWMLIALYALAIATPLAVGGGAEAMLVVLVISAFVVHNALAVWVSFHASYLLSAARDRGELELLLATPLKDQEIVDGYVQAVKQLFWKPAVVLLSIEGLAGVSGAVVIALHLQDSSIFASWLVLAGTIFFLLGFVFDLFAATYFGLWMGLVSKQASHAFGKTVLFLFVLPFFLTSCCWPATSVINIIKSIIFLNYARDQLRRRFRQMVVFRASGTQEQ